MTVQFRLLCYTRQACLRGGGALRRTLVWRSESAPLDSQQTCLLKMKWSGLVVSSQQADSEDGKVHRTRPKCKNTCAYTAVPPLRRHHPRSVVKFFLPSALPLYCNPCCLSFFPVPDFFFFFLALLTIQDVFGWCPEATLRERLYRPAAAEKQPVEFREVCGLGQVKCRPLLWSDSHWGWLA